MIHQRTPAVADMVVRTMEEEAPAHGCLSDLQTATRRLDNEGFWWRPSWKALRDFDAYLRDMNVDVVASDGGRIEVLAQDLPCCGVHSLQWTSHSAVS